MSISFKAFRSGLKKVMAGARHPLQKEPFRVEFFPFLHRSMDLSTADNRLLFLLVRFFLRAFSRFRDSGVRLSSRSSSYESAIHSSRCH